MRPLRIARRQVALALRLLRRHLLVLAMVAAPLLGVIAGALVTLGDPPPPTMHPYPPASTAPTDEEAP